MSDKQINKEGLQYRHYDLNEGRGTKLPENYASKLIDESIPLVPFALEVSFLYNGTMEDHSVFVFSPNLRDFLALNMLTTFKTVY